MDELQFQPFNFGAIVWQPLVFKLIPNGVFPKPYWHTDYNAALQQAAALKKVVLALFTLPSACSFCKALEIEVLSTGLFSTWARQTVVLLKPDLQKGVPNDLVSKYEAWAVPAALGLNPDGTERGRVVGYSIGTGPTKWLMMFEAAAKMNQTVFP